MKKNVFIGLFLFGRKKHGRLKMRDLVRKKKKYGGFFYLMNGKLYYDRNKIMVIKTKKEGINFIYIIRKLPEYNMGILPLIDRDNRKK